MVENGYIGRKTSMKLSDYPKSIGVSYKKRLRMWKRGDLNATQLTTGMEKPIKLNVLLNACRRRNAVS